MRGNRTVKGTIKASRRVLIVSGIVLCALSTLSFQDKPRESVTVTAVEVPVRVFDKNGFVSGLTKEDFEVFENGVKQEITGFEAVSRTISPIQNATPDAIPRPPRKRNFLLIFNVFDYTPQVGEAIDYLFQKILRPEDRLMILVEDKFFSLQTGHSLAEVAADLKKTLTRYKVISRREIGKAFADLDRAAGVAVSGISEDPGDSGDPGNSGEFGDSGGSGESGNPVMDIARFYDLYMQVWLDYRKRLLDFDLDLYRGIAKRMQKLDGDKWAICFQQRDLFPQFKSQGRLERALDRLVESGGMMQQLVESKKSEIRRSQDLGKSHSAELIRSLFTEANITFHLLIMKSIGAAASNESRDLELRDVQPDYEDALRRISTATGGLTIFSNRAIDTLKAAAVKEDQYYLLVYQSNAASANKESAIDVRVRRTEAEVIALKKRVKPSSVPIAVSGFVVKGKRVEYDVIGGGRLELGGWNTGKIAIRVTAFNAKSIKVFDEAKRFDLMADSIHLSLDLRNLSAGDYFVIIEAVDLVTGDKDVFSRAMVF
jgi:VWFA-related protein